VTNEEKQQLIWARGQAMAAMACVQQLCRVMQEHGIVTTEQLRDAISEALAMAGTWNPDDAFEREVARVIGITIQQAFEDRRP
jgi:hypothetical protein